MVIGARTGAWYGGIVDGHQVSFITRLQGGNDGDGVITTDAYFGGSSDYTSFFSKIRFSVSSGELINGGVTHLTNTNPRGVPNNRLFVHANSWYWDVIDGKRKISPTIETDVRYDLELSFSSMGSIMVDASNNWYTRDYGWRIYCDQLGWDYSSTGGVTYVTINSPSVNVQKVNAHIFKNSFGNFYGLKMWNWDGSILEADIVPWCDADGVPCVKNLVTGVKSYANRPDLYWALPT